MPTTHRLPVRARIGVAAVIVLLVAAIGGGTAAVQYGAHTIEISDGDVQSVGPTATPQWAGFELADMGATPITLRSVELRKSENARLLEARIVEPAPGEGGFAFMGAPLPPELQQLLADSHPVDGFVLPPSSGSRYELVVLVQPEVTGRQAVVLQTALTYSALGLDQGIVSHAVFCIRATGRSECSGT